MIQYPIFFEVQARANDDLMSPWRIQSDDREANCCVPKSFEGPGGVDCPEDFFAQALVNCFVATFKVYAFHSKLEFKGLEAKAKLTVDKGDDRKVCMKRLDMDLTLRDVSSIDRAKILIKKAFESGFILNSVKTQIAARFNVTDSQGNEESLVLER